MPTYLTPRSAKALAEAIEEAGFSYTQLGLKVGVSGQFIGRLAAGDRKHVNAPTASLIEEAVGKPLGSLFHLKDAGDLSPYLPEDAA